MDIVDKNVKLRRKVITRLSEWQEINKSKDCKNHSGNHSINRDVSNKLILNDIDFIGQSIKIDTHAPTKC